MIAQMNQQTEQLFTEYKKTRSANISIEEFEYILSLFPSLMICMSDGKLDPEEWDAVLQLADGMAEEFYNDQSTTGDKTALAMNFRTEFRYLLENLAKWEKKFLNVLKDHIKSDRTSKEFVLESMYLFANAADGISEVEQESIDELSKRLQLEY
ncbi:MAG: hypothetical protein RIF33_15080 [Cyclobacteriaceae bacterium]